MRADGVVHPFRRPFAVLAAVLALFLVAPLVVTAPVSVTTTRYVSMPTAGVSFGHYVRVFTDPAWLAALRDSLVVALGATALATALGAGGAIGVWRRSGPIAGALRAVVLMPLIVPPVVTALALSRAWVKLGLFDTLAGVILAHAIVAMPFVFLTVSAALEGLDPRIEPAARSLGAGPFTTVRRILLPNVLPGLGAGALFAFVISWDEVTVTLFVSSRAVFTLPRKIWSEIRDNIDPAVAVVSVFTVAVALAIGLAVVARPSRAGGRRDRGGSGPSGPSAEALRPQQTIRPAPCAARRDA
ncbi:ABC transporter permease [Methyloraptor flagellatus]|uniref:ABC transporter permease n=1 Tax=Methyloraptor flagellatus TaxID=3162530 RepID=A0AAU7X5V3_9HYPH